MLFIHFARGSDNVGIANGKKGKFPHKIYRRKSVLFQGKVGGEKVAGRPKMQLLWQTLSQSCLSRSHLVTKL